MTKPKTASKKTAAKTVTVVEPQPGCEIAIVGNLQPGAIAHMSKIVYQHTELASGSSRWYEETTTVCSGELAKSCSYGWAKAKGAVPCTACFGGAK